jgi:DNA-binding NarL/FixJ family response regulator
MASWRKNQSEREMNVLIADDHAVVRRGLKDILADEFAKLYVGEACNGQETLEAARKQVWDIVMLDIKMPGRSGLEVLEELKKLHPKMPVVMISAFPEEDYALRAFKLGASGYVSKGGASDELLAAIRKALAGGRYVTPSLAEKLAATLSGEAPVAPHESLSNRELEVLRLIAAGKTIKEVAAELSLSEKTIGTYRLRLSKKIGLSTNVELARYALQHKLVD